MKYGKIKICVLVFVKVKVIAGKFKPEKKTGIKTANYWPELQIIQLKLELSENRYYYNNLRQMLWLQNSIPIKLVKTISFDLDEFLPSTFLPLGSFTVEN